MTAVAVVVEPTATEYVQLLVGAFAMVFAEVAFEVVVLGHGPVVVVNWAAPERPVRAASLETKHSEPGVAWTVHEPELFELAVELRHAQLAFENELPRIASFLVEVRLMMLREVAAVMYSQRQLAVFAFLS